jgi:KDO2-lipid IV(A) lauroyltransferase
VIILLKFLQWCFGLIFRLPAPLAIGFMHLAGEISYQLARRTPLQKIGAKNFGLLFEKINNSQLANQLLKNVGYAVFEVLCLPFLKEAHFKRIVRINGVENIDRGLAKGKGVLLLLIHSGNYELTPPLLAARGYRLNSILKAPDEPIFKLINRSRSYRGIKLINVLEDDMYRESLRALANNELVGLLVDTGASEGRHETIEFLGRKVPVAAGWLTLAQRSGAAVIPSLSKREGEKIAITFGEALNVSKDNKEEVIKKLGQFYENFIRHHPEQWLIFLNSHEVERMVEGG